VKEEIRLGKYSCEDGTSFEVTKVDGDSVIVVDGATMHFSRIEFGYLVAMQKAVHQSLATYTFTTDELDLLIKTACQMQAAECGEVYIWNSHHAKDSVLSVINNAPCPDTVAVLAKFEEVKKDG